MLLVIAVSASGGCGAAGDIQVSHDGTEQVPEDDTTEEVKEMNTENIEVFTQNSIRITSGNKIIYIDPFQLKKEPHDADLILITHDHYDHCSPDDIAKAAKEGTVIAAPESTVKKLEKELPGSGQAIETVEPGGKTDINKVPVETVRAYNNSKDFHPKSAGWVGYILDIDGMRVYIAGDTDVTEDNLKVRCDVALVPIGGTYTMDAKEAADLINSIRPKAAIPTHYGSVVGNDDLADIFAGLVDDGIKVEIKKQY